MHRLNITEVKQNEKLGEGVVLKFHASHLNVETEAQRHAQKLSRKKRTELSLEPGSFSCPTAFIFFAVFKSTDVLRNI